MFWKRMICHCCVNSFPCSLTVNNEVFSCDFKADDLKWPLFRPTPILQNQDDRMNKVAFAVKWRIVSRVVDLERVPVCLHSLLLSLW